MRPALRSKIALALIKLSALHKYRLSQTCPHLKTRNRSQKIVIGTCRQPISSFATLAQEDMPNKRLKTSMGPVDGPLAGLEPANVWGFFNELTKIPRPSKHEEKCACLCLTSRPAQACAQRKNAMQLQTFNTALGATPLWQHGSLHLMPC